jgi:hypothetical protein
MKKSLGVVTVVVLGAVAGQIDHSGAFPGVDSCTAAMIGQNIAVANLNSCINADPPEDCTYEQLAVTWATHRVLNYCFGIEF